MINLHSSVLKRQIGLNSEASMGDFYNIVSQFKIEGKIKDTTLVVFSYKGNKIVKRYYKSNRAKNR